MGGGRKTRSGQAKGEGRKRGGGGGPLIHVSPRHNLVGNPTTKASNTEGRTAAPHVPSDAPALHSSRATTRHATPRHATPRHAAPCNPLARLGTVAGGATQGRILNPRFFQPAEACVHSLSLSLALSQFLAAVCAMGNEGRPKNQHSS